MKDKWKCKNPIICNSFKDQLEKQYKSRPNIRVLQRLLGKKTTSIISNTNNFPSYIIDGVEVFRQQL